MKKTKICTKCGKRKPIGEFSIDNSKKDGHKNYCKECAAKMDAKRRADKKRLSDAKKSFEKSLDEEVANLKAKENDVARIIVAAVDGIANSFGYKVEFSRLKLRKK